MAAVGVDMNEAGLRPNFFVDEAIRGRRRRIPEVVDARPLKHIAVRQRAEVALAGAPELDIQAAQGRHAERADIKEGGGGADAADAHGEAVSDAAMKGWALVFDHIKDEALVVYSLGREDVGEQGRDDLLEFSEVGGIAAAAAAAAAH